MDETIETFEIQNTSPFPVPFGNQAPPGVETGKCLVSRHSSLHCSDIHDLAGGLEDRLLGKDIK